MKTKKKGHKKGWRRFWQQYRFYMATLLAFFVLSIASLHILQNKLLENAQKTGESLAISFSVEEERSLSAYEALLRMGSAHLERLTKETEDNAKIEVWLRGFFEDIQKVTDQMADPYAILNGDFVGKGDEKLEDYDYTGSEWYQRALEADGEVIYTDLYEDAVYNREVVTIAVKSGEEGNVLAFDIFPENFQMLEHQVTLPEGSSYFLCDRKENLLYAKTELSVSREEMQQYLNSIITKLKKGELDSKDSSIIDLDGRRRSVYYSVSENGWFSIVTVPHRTILGDLRKFTVGFAVVFLLFLSFTALTSIRNSWLNRKIERTNDTVRVLGNAYYAIYRLDYEEGTYEMIKGSDYLRKRIPQKGDYQTFLTEAAAIIEKDAYLEFKQSFSIENVKKLVKRRVRDYGGDFLRLFNDEYRWVNVRLLFDESLSQGEVVICFREIDEEKQVQLHHMALMENALDKARKNEESQNRFFSTMSHDMRTPLNAIIGLTELAEKSYGDAGQTAEYLTKIRTASQQLLTLINDLLEISRLERGKIDLNREPFDIKDCVEKCAEIFRAQARKEDKQFTLSFDVSDPVVLGDASRVTQILNNLISNAVKYSDEGDSIDVRVRQMGSQKIKKYQFIIADTGRGMTPEFLDKLFKPYEREVRFGARGVAGTGLGMPIVKSLVSQMDGQITVESRLGEGSTFTVTLSLESVEKPVQDDGSTDNPAKQEILQLAGRRALVAEDNDVNMEIATEILEMHDMKVTQAWNGREAVDCFRQSPEGYFDVILMDMQMPEMDGCEAATTIRAMNRADARTIPILAVTANAFAEDIAATTKAGMNAHISKPIDFSVLYQTLAELLAAKTNDNSETQ